jgi:hypothetical protein
MKFPTNTAFNTLSDIRHNRYGGALDLPHTSELFGKRPLLGSLIHRARTIPSFLPGD